MLKKICFLVNYNQYETKRHFTEKFTEALLRKGIEVKIFDVSETKIHEKTLEAIKNEEPDFTASFNSILPLPNNLYLWDMLKIPHLSIVLDPSLYSVHLINSPYSIISCVDQFDCYGLSTQHFDRVFLMPHAIERELCETPEGERPYDVVFMGSCYDYETLRQSWQRELPEPVCALLDSAIDIVLSDNKTPLQQALVKAWKESGLAPEGIDFLKLFTYVDKYSRGLDRTNLIKSIKDAHVHVFGDLFEDDPTAIKGWKELLKGHDNVTVHKAVSFNEALEVMKKSKICLNSCPFFKYGSHERIFAGAACGSVVVTSDNLFVREHFVDGEDILLYQSKELDGLNEKINHYLAHEDLRKKCAEAAKEKVQAYDTWDNRVDILNEIMPAMIDRCPPPQ